MAPTIRRRLVQARGRLVQMVDTLSLVPDETNPRKQDPARMGLLRLSIKKLGFIQPVFADRDTGLLLSGHQRTSVAKELGIAKVPVIYMDVKDKNIKGSNILFNRATNDFAAFDTGEKAAERLDMDRVLGLAEALPDYTGDPLAYNAVEQAYGKFLEGEAERYDKKAVNMASTLAGMGIRIPIVVSQSGQIVNGIYRAFAAAERGDETWPIVTIPDNMAEVALAFLNYLSMDFHVGEDFERLLRHGAYRRPQNNRGNVPKAMRFWANGLRTLPDRDSYSKDYFQKFRQIHGQTVLDFGAGLGNAAPYLSEHGIDAHDFEPFRIRPDAGAGEQSPDPDYSRQKAREFLSTISNHKLKFDSIFLCSVLNSVPFFKDRMCVLAIVHALSTRVTAIYGTCRDISDYNYEYGGIRNANYFTFDSEDGVRLGDVMRNPKIQKFHTQSEARDMFSRLWNGIEFWAGGNVFYFKLTAPKGINTKVLADALEYEFGTLPYADGSTMNLVNEAKEAFSKRLMTTVR